MTPCTVDGRRSMRLTKHEIKTLVAASELVHHLLHYDKTLGDASESLELACKRIDEVGTYIPFGKI